MKAGLTTSVVLHAALLSYGLLSLSAPRPFDIAQESLAVSIIPVEDIAQATQGDEKAPVAERSAPLPTERPDIVADAQKVGENSVDTDAPVTPEAKPRPVETADAPAPQPKPVVKPQEEETPEPVKEPTPVPATEVAPVPKPKQEVAPEPVKEAEAKPEEAKPAEPQPAPEPSEQTAAIDPAQSKPDEISEAIDAEKPKQETVELPTSAPAPEARPRPAEAQTAKAPDRKAAEKPVKEAASKPKSDSTDESVEDKVAELLNKDKASGGGAKRSKETAALGGKKKTGEKLTNSEMGALSDQLGNCWSIPAGAVDGGSLRVSVRFNVTTAGKLDGRPQVESSSGNQQFDESAVRAVQKCDREGLDLPSGKEDIWAEVVVNFDPTEMGM
jgi:colicin import membrane protein